MRNAVHLKMSLTVEASVEDVVGIKRPLLKLALKFLRNQFYPLITKKQRHQFYEDCGLDENEQNLVLKIKKIETSRVSYI